MSFHYSPTPLSYGEKTVSFCSFASPKDLMIFIHGFNGDATETWKEFPELLTTHQKFQYTDIAFFGYDSLKGQAGNLRIKFFKAVDALSKPYSIQEYPQRDLPVNFTYERIIIVAHSLGAVVTRMMLLYAKQKQVSWLCNCNLIFYAPAHWGSRIPENFKECFFGVSVLLQAFAVTKYPIIKDLTEGSLVLTNLKTDIDKILQTESNCNFIKAKVVWAERENVVINYSYGQDEPEDEILGTTHTSVCKPRTNGSLEPFNFLLNAI